MNSQQALLIAKYSARYSVRGGVGLVFLLLSMTFGLMVAHFTLQPVEMATRQIAEQQRGADPDEIRAQVLDNLIDHARPAVAWVLSTGSNDAQGRDVEADSWAGYLLLDRPAMLSAIFLILLWGWPFLVVTGAFDLYAGDIASRQLRYQLLRADRGSIFMGRLLGTTLTFVTVLAVLGITVAIYIGLKLPIYGWGSLLGWTLYGVAALIVVSLPYIALCAWISASITSPFASLTILSLVVGGVPMFAAIGKLTFDGARYVNYLLPWGFQTRLFHPELLQVVAAVIGCFGMTGLFGWLGYRKFTTRDL